jgi:exopolysaccharide biosynthesis polyprenyl glycosylphosphotransferase
MLVVAFFLMLVIRFPNRISHDVISDHFFPFLLVFGIWLLVFFLFNLYETESVKPTIPHLRIIGIASMVALATSTILFYLVPSFGITPKTNLVIFSAIFVLFFLIWRRIFYNIFSVYFRKEIAFVVEQNKDSNCIRKIINYIKICPQSGFYVLGTYSSLEEFMTRQDQKQVDTLIISKNSLKETKDLILIYSVAKNILDLTYAYENILGKIPVDSIDETWFLHNIQNTTTIFHKIISHLMNVVVAFIILLATFPFLLIVALFIKLNDRGPVFYTQLRVGKNGKIFKLYKFRSMFVNADKNGAEWTEKNDQRITKVGKIIRKLHIDEVPQLWNVIKGEMSLVGPRPEIISFEEKLSKEIPHYGLRHIITPGFTGWAQIKFRNARGIEESKEKFEYDLYYIKNRNIFMDFGIILRTIQIIFTH